MMVLVAGVAAATLVRPALVPSVGSLFVKSNHLPLKSTALRLAMVGQGRWASWLSPRR